MASERWQRLEELFAQAVELEGEERELYIERQCGGDPGLMYSLRGLLDSDGEAGDFLAGPMAENDPASGAPAAQRPPGRRIGPYRLLEPIGEGGMSTVFRAVHEGAFERQVALKLIRRGMESAETRRRLEAERQILAGLEHPHIARLYDGGTTEEGLPYFVMEHVEGLPVDLYCDRHRLSLRSRIGIFRMVCEAVHFAHQNLVVHRDIKPNNILVTAAGEPKLLDFGIAKLLAPAGGGEPTVAWLRVLTPGYASPEQLQGLPVTTASDTYSLGVLLYRLLTGRLPHDLEGLGLTEIEAQVLERGPPRPSRRLPEAGDDGELAAVAGDRACRPEALRRSLEGDLDTILLRALHRDPRRRYGSARELAEDLRRHLEGFPVLARPDSAGYRAGKFLRRHRLAVAATALIVLLAAGSLAVFLSQAARIRLERDQLREVISFAVAAFDVAGEGENLSVRQAVDRSADLLEQRLQGQPQVQATLRQTLGLIYLNLGVTDQAETQLEQAVELQRSRFGAGSPELAASLGPLGIALAMNGDFDGGERRARQAVQLYRQSLGESDPAYVGALNDLVAVLCFRADSNEQAEQLAQRSLELARKVLAPEDPRLGEALAHRALLLSRRGEHEAARRHYEQVLELYRGSLGEEHPRVAEVIANLSFATRQQGDLEAAAQLYRRTLELQRRLFGRDSSTVALTLNNFAALLRSRGDYPQAAAAYREAMEVVAALHGEGDYSTLITTTGLASVLNAAGDPAAARALLEPRLGLWRETLAGQWFVAHAESVYGESLVGLGRFAEAEELLQGAYERLRQGRGDDFPKTREALERLVGLYGSWGKPAEEGLYRSRLNG